MGLARHRGLHGHPGGETGQEERGQKEQMDQARPGVFRVRLLTDAKGKGSPRGKWRDGTGLGGMRRSMAGWEEPASAKDGAWRL